MEQGSVGAEIGSDVCLGSKKFCMASLLEKQQPPRRRQTPVCTVGPICLESQWLIIMGHFKPIVWSTLGSSGL